MLSIVVMMFAAYTIVPLIMYWILSHDNFII